MADPQPASFSDRFSALTTEDPALAEAKRRMGSQMAPVQPQTPATRPALAPVENPQAPQLSTGAMGMPPPPQLKNMPSPQPADDRNPLEVFDIFKNPAIVLAGIGSLFSRNSLTTAFNAGAGAINGFRSGQKQVFDENRERWHQAAQQALDQNAMELTKYKLALERRDMKARMASMYALASQYNDPIISVMMKNGDFEGAYGLVTKREEAQTAALKALQTYELKQEAEDSRIEQLKKDPSIIRHAQEIYDNRAAPITGVAAWRNPTGRATMELVEQLGEQKGTPYDQTAYVTRTKTENAFATGAESKTVRSLNNAIGHLATVDRLIDALKNNDIPLFNRIMQSAQIRTGAGQAVTNYNMAREIVGGEIEKAVVVGGGTGGERENIRAQFASTSSPEMMHGPVNVARELLARQFEGIKKQYESGGGQKDFNKTFMLPDTAKVFEKITKGEETAPAAPEMSGWTYEEVK